jgi:hypothetical protein
MDPPGLALEQYDGVGAYRSEDNGAPIDPSGQLAGGAAFSGPDELSRLVAANPELPRCVARHLLTYGLGRSVRPESGFDTATLDAVAKTFIDSGQLFPQLVDAVATSDAFRSREDEAAP